jgi:hypothetical protein
VISRLHVYLLRDEREVAHWITISLWPSWHQWERRQAVGLWPGDARRTNMRLVGCQLARYHIVTLLWAGDLACVAAKQTSVGLWHIANLVRNERHTATNG